MMSGDGAAVGRAAALFWNQSAVGTLDGKRDAAHIRDLIDQYVSVTVTVSE